VYSAAVNASQMERPGTLGEAAAALEAPGSVALAGGTWIMRAPIRDEPWADTYVALGGIAELHEIESGPVTKFGACVSHAELARATAGQPWLRALNRAADGSANPAIRRVATLGGNLCATGFPAADLIPALLALDARVVLRSGDAKRELPLAEFLRHRSTFCSGGLVCSVVLDRRELLCSHVRLPLRVAGGDYPVAIVSLAVARDSDGLIQEAAVAVGSVEPLARRWTELEAAMVGQPGDAQSAAAAAERLSGEWSGRDGVDAPGWYRVRVLSALVRRAMGEILAPPGGS
jgi:aerobic carbon-monoxide dehydrogenase medium subunit